MYWLNALRLDLFNLRLWSVVDEAKVVFEILV